MESSLRAALPKRGIQRIADDPSLIWWSYPDLYLRAADGGVQQALDLLVVLGDDLLLVSEQLQLCEDTGDVTADWSRWYTDAVQAGVTRLADAEHWLRTTPEDLFLDAACTQPLASVAVLPDLATAHLHHLLVADGATERALRHWQGEGAVGINSCIRGQAHVGEGCAPFVLGRVTDVDGVPWVHVFDAVGLDVVLHVMDTIPDLRTYLRARANLLAGATQILASGEEELVARYVTDNGLMNGMFDLEGGAADGSGRSVRAARAASATGDAKVLIAGGAWDALRTSPAWTAHERGRQQSSIWDVLIDIVAEGASEDEDADYPLDAVHTGSVGHLTRCLSNEPRALRIALTEAFTDVKRRGLWEPVAVRVALPGAASASRVSYVLMAFDRNGEEDEDRYSERREAALLDYCMVVRYLYPDMVDVVGIATEPGLTDIGRGTFDLLHLDGRTWTPEQQEEARMLHEEIGLLSSFTVAPTMNVAAASGVRRKITGAGVPVGVDTGVGMKGSERNQPCPCGSGRKFKHCHGRPGR